MQKKFIKKAFFFFIISILITSFSPLLVKAITGEFGGGMGIQIVVNDPSIDYDDYPENNQSIINNEDREKDEEDDKDEQIKKEVIHSLDTNKENNLKQKIEIIELKSVYVSNKSINQDFVIISLIMSFILLFLLVISLTLYSKIYY